MTAIWDLFIIQESLSSYIYCCNSYYSTVLLIPSYLCLFLLIYLINSACMQTVYACGLTNSETDFEIELKTGYVFIFFRRHSYIS